MSLRHVKSSVNTPFHHMKRLSTIVRSSLFALLLLLLIPAAAFAQGVTTSTLAGSVIDESGDPLPGATVVAVHEPSGTQHGTTTGSDGYFRIANMRAGGPYTLTVSFIGYNRSVFESIQLRLGETYFQQVTLSVGDVELDEVFVTGYSDRIFNQERTGAATNVTAEQIERIPTITRSINDLTQLTPQSSGTSFAGRDNRFNNYTVDGSVYNNNFGLSNDQFAGGNPIRLGVVEEVKVKLATSDGRGGGVTGANVNAITRSGSNTFSGTGYMYYRNQDLVGSRIGNNELNINVSFTRTTDASVSAP